MSRRSPTRATVAFTLALGVAVFVASAGLGIAWRSTPQVSDQAASLLSTIIGAAIGAVATFLGIKDDPPRP